MTCYIFKREQPKFLKKYSDYCLDIAAILVKAGIDCNATSNDGETALMVAVRQVSFISFRLCVEDSSFIVIVKGFLKIKICHGLRDL